MKILVCIKQVPDPESKPRINEANNWAHYGDKVSYWINRYDEHAVEEALRIKERIPAARIDIVPIDPSELNFIRRCLEMGADRVFTLL